MSRRIGIFGGSFNPVHRGHLKLAKAAISELNLDKVIFVPSRLTPLKNAQDLLPAEVRVRLLKRAVDADRRFGISLCEMKRPGVSYTVDTLKFFKKKYGGSAVMYFLAGNDTVRNLPRWKKLPEVLRLSRFVIFSRPGHAVRAPKGPFLFMPFDAIDVSASQIRKRLQEGRSVRELVPPGAENELKRYFKAKTKRRASSNTIVK
ncbi:MAG TPA: nicotinate-nucleotide adenylyltransferase [Candidatus Omnitrophota bacterium]|nr:nicotinate-nucleotide adenylyltransferase [Candidatus Omnitrophota bacterium]